MVEIRDQIERRPIGSLIPYARNSRTHSDAQIQQLAASMREWGWTNPVLVDEAGGIIAGHGRVLAAQRLQISEVPVIVASGWTDAQAWYGDRAQSDVWSMSRAASAAYVHPTQKPVELVERAVGNSSKAGDVVVDCFGGSGSTLIACEKTGRHARLMELDPKYCDVIVKRWQDFTGKQATLESDGRTFAEVQG